MNATIYLHSSKEANWEIGQSLGLTGAALQMFKHALCEVKVDVEVDPKTGLATIVAVNDWLVVQP